MTEWYYSDAQRTQHGPLGDSPTQLHVDTAESQSMSAPPPLPPRPSHSDQLADAFAHSQNAPPPAPVPKQGMPGCGIAAIIGAVVVVLCLFIAGIYIVNAVRDEQQAQAESTRIKISKGLAGLELLKATVDDYVSRNRACPSNLALKMPKDATFAFSNDGSLPASLRVGALSNGHCVIELRFASLEPAVEGTLVLESTENGWACSGGTLDAKFRPAQCRSSELSP